MATTIKDSVKLSLLVLIFFLALLLVSCGEENFQNFDFSELKAPEKKPFLIGQVPSQSIIQLLETQKKFTRVLEDYLDREVQFRFASEYQQIINRLKQNRYQLAILGPFAYVQASKKSNYRPLVRPVRYGKPYYRSIIFTHQNSGITSASEIEGKSMAFVDPDSTSGYLFPRALLIKKYGFDPLAKTTQHQFLGRHDAVARAVLNKQFDAGATFDDARTLVTENKINEKLPILARSKPIPSEPYVISDKLSENKKLTKKIRDFFLTLHKKNKPALHSLGDDIEKFAPATDSDYDQVRKVQATLQKYNGGGTNENQP